MNSATFDTFALNDNKFQIDHRHYLLEDTTEEDNKENEELLIYRSYKVSVAAPHICVWDYLSKQEVVNILSLNKTETRKFIEGKIKKKAKGLIKIVFRELMYTVVKFCKKSKFGSEQAGAVLSQFYLTHVFFTSDLEMGAEKVYNYFKELQICHSLPFPPSSIKLFNLEEIRSIMTYFCKVYLRNLPLIRFLTLPNFTLQVNYRIDPAKPLKDKGKKKKKKKHKKK